MPKPTIGRPYTVVKGDTLWHIASAAYGDPSKWRVLWKNNQTRLRSGNPNLIYPGEIINIGPLTELVEVANEQRQDIELPDKAPNEFTLIIGDKEVPVTAARIMRTMDTVADGWSATVQFDTEVWNSDVYTQAKVYLGGRLIIDGLLYGVRSSTATDGTKKSLTGWSVTADLIDSTMKAPYERSNMTLEQIAKDIIEPIGLPIVFDADDTGGVFKRATAQSTDTVAKHLTDLASQRGILMTSTPKSEVLFIKPNVDGQVVGSLADGLPPLMHFDMDYDGRKRFNVYKAVGSRERRKTKWAVAKDDNVPRSRFKTISTPDTTIGDIQRAADWARSKQIAEALTTECPVSGWYAPDGNLWEENTLVAVNTKTLQIPDGFVFLIRAVEYRYEAEGTMTILSLVPPQTYTGESLTDIWGTA
jgi:prophage tail gpP-like protein